MLLGKGYIVHGIKRRSSSFNTARIDHLYLDPHLRRPFLSALLGPDRCHQPDPHRPGGAAGRDLQSGRAEPRQVSFETAGIHRQRRRHRHAAPAGGDPHPRLGDRPASTRLNLRALRQCSERRRARPRPFYPRSPYAAAKLYAYWITVNYREAYGMHASNGILFNHESPLRGETFVTRKITRAVAAIELGLQERLYLGNLERQARLGPRARLVEGMWRILQQDRPDDYVLATGEAHTVRDFVELAFGCVGRNIEWSGSGLDETGLDGRTGNVLVEIDERYYRPTEVDFLLGDASKARDRLGWTPKVPFPALVQEMVEADLLTVEREGRHNEF